MPFTPFASFGPGIPAGVPFTTTKITNPIYGTGQVTVVEFPRDDVALALGVAGDAFPQILLTPQGQDGLYFSDDGTVDPYNSGASGVINIKHGSGTPSAKAFQMFGGAGRDVVVAAIAGKAVYVPSPLHVQNDDLTFDTISKGPVVKDDANAHTYRLGTHNGALTLTQVT